MRFDVIFYETADGEKPVVDFLDHLRVSHATLHKLAVAGMRKLEDSQQLKEPLTKCVHTNWKIYELRVGAVNIARLFFFFQKGQRIIITHDYVKKSQRLDRAELERARRSMTDWEERNP